MIEWAPLITAFSIGFFSSIHCVGMCGGIMGALTMAIPASERHRRFWLLVSYNIGRIGSYALMGLLVGFLMDQLPNGASSGLRIFAGLLLVAMALYLADWWRGLVYLEKLGRYLWAYLQPLGRALMPVASTPHALLLGGIWGWLPCGLVYTALVYASTQAQEWKAALVMAAFGIGTLPAVLATGLGAQQLIRILQRRFIRISVALVIFLFGVWTIYAALPSHHHHAAPSHEVPIGEGFIQPSPPRHAH